MLRSQTICSDGQLSQILTSGLDPRKMWKENVEGKCGRKIWKENMEGICGRKMWKENVAGGNIDL